MFFCNVQRQLNCLATGTNTQWHGSISHTNRYLTGILICYWGEHLQYFYCQFLQLLANSYVILLFSEPFHTLWSHLEPNTPACLTARGFDVSANINRFQSARYDILTVLLLKIQIFFTVILCHWACSSHCFEDHLVLRSTETSWTTPQIHSVTSPDYSPNNTASYPEKLESSSSSSFIQGAPGGMCRTLGECSLS